MLFYHDVDVFLCNETFVNIRRTILPMGKWLSPGDREYSVATSLNATRRFTDRQTGGEETFAVTEPSKRMYGSERSAMGELETGNDGRTV